ncbi:MAG: thioredoxin domain-containing protein [Ramlibacter sp.]
MNTSKLLLALAFGATALLSGCDKAPDTAPGAAAKPASETVSVAAVAAEAKGFTVGSEMSVRRVFVFFDPQCPHCAELWLAAKPLKSQARFIWIPVALMNKASESQGAALLAAPDPVAAMDQHEASMRAKQGGIDGASAPADQKAQVMANTKLMNRFGFNSIPTIVATHATTGALVVREGGLPTVALADALGLSPP